MSRDPGPSLAHQKTGPMKPGQEQKKENGPPMLAKRFIVAAFAALTVGMSSLAFSNPDDLFVDMPAKPAVIASILD